MINYKIYNSLLEIEDLNLESSLSSLTLQDQKVLESLKVLQVKEEAHFQRDMLSLFRDFLVFSTEAHKVYWVLLEPYPQARNRIRSKKGLFYPHKTVFERPATYETEIEISPGETLLAGIIQVTVSNINNLIDHFDKLPFAFGLAVPQQKRTFANCRKDWLETLAKQGLKPGKIYWKNWLKIAALLVKPQRKIFTLQTLNDREYLRFFYHKADSLWEQELERFVTEQFQNSPIFQNQ